MTLSRKSRFWIGGILLGIGLTAITISVYNSPDYAPPPLPVPSPNGYDDFVAAAKLHATVPGDVPWPKEKGFTIEHARQYVSHSRAVLERVELGLTKETAVPIAFTTNWLNEHVNTYSELKNLERVITLQGYVSEKDGRLHEAVVAYVEGLKFASAVGHGGLLIDCLISSANERIAVSYLGEVVPKLDAADCRFVLAELEQWKTNREPFELTAQRESKWANVFFRMEYGGWRFVMMSAAEKIASKSLHPEAAVIAKAKMKYETVAGQVEALRVRLAVRAFEAEHGASPKDWGDLVPAYLPVIPIDPQTQRPFAHQF